MKEVESILISERRRISYAVFIMLLILPLSISKEESIYTSQPFIGSAKPSQPQMVMLELADSQSLPSVRFQIAIISGYGILGRVQAPIQIGIVENAPTQAQEQSSYNMGFSFEPISIDSSLLLEDIQGIGINEVTSYPYVYLNSTLYYDHWLDSSPDYIMRRPFPFWGIQSGEGLYAGAFLENALAGNITVGQYLHLEGIHLYFGNGTAISCSPSNLLIWVEFEYDGEWQQTLGIWNSTSQVERIGNDSTTLTTEVFPPLNILRISIITAAIIATLTTILYIYRKKKQSF